MKLIVAILATSLAAVHAEQCDLSKFQALLADPAVKACTEQSQYSFVPPTRPTDEQLTAICKSDACKQVLSAVAAMGLPDCEIGTVSVKKDLIERVTQGCTADGSSATPTPTTSDNATTTNSSMTTANTTMPSATPVPSATKVNTTTAPPMTKPPQPTMASSKAEDEPEEEVEEPSSSSGDTDIDEVSPPEEIETPEPPAPTKKTAPTSKPPTSDSVRRAIATGGVVLASLLTVAFV